MGNDHVMSDISTQLQGALHLLPAHRQHELFEQAFSEAQSQSRELRQAAESASGLARFQVRVFKRLDEALAAVPKTFGTSLACRPGCAMCCHYRVVISPVEAFTLAEHIRGLKDAAARDAVLQRLRANKAAIDKLSIEQHIATNVRCAFLGDDDRCTAYEARPGACRKHHSADVRPCRETFDDPSNPAQNPQVPDILASADVFLAATFRASHEHGMDMQMYEMTAAVLEAYENPAALRRFRSGKVSFPSVRDRQHLIPGAA